MFAKKVLQKVLFSTLFVTSTTFAQNQGGLIPLDPQLYQSLPTSVFSLKNIGKLPAKVDLSPHTLIALSQGEIGSCASMTVAYEISRLERTRNKWPISEKNTFSASYLYNQANGGIDRGSSFFTNFNLAVNRGCATFQTFPYTVNYLLQPGAKAHEEAAIYKILEWKRIDHNVESFKSWIAAGHGIVCSFNLWDNFDNYRGGIYRPSGPRGVLRKGERFPVHGCLITGYDDERQHFKVINSWGEYWGEKGFWFFEYRDIKNLIAESYVIIPKTKLNPPANIEASKGVYRDTIIISWKPVDNGAEHLVFRLEDNEYKLLGKSSTNRFEDKSAEKGKKYFYYVASIAGNTMSRYSSPVEGWIKNETAPGIPQGITVVQLISSVLLSWDTGEDTDHYEIYRWDEKESGFTLAGKTARTLFQDQNISGSKGQLAAYIIVAVNQYGKSLPSTLSFIVLDSGFKGKESHDNGKKTFYKGPFYQFPINRFNFLEQKFQGRFEQIQAQWNSHSSLKNKNFKGGK